VEKYKDMGEEEERRMEGREEGRKDGWRRVLEAMVHTRPLQIRLLNIGIILLI